MRTWVWMVGFLLLGLGACGTEDVAGPQPLEVEQARQLVADAASLDRETLERIANLGAKLTPDEAEQGPDGMPLTLALLMLRLPPEDFSVAPGATPASVMQAIDPRGEKLGLRLRARPSILHTDHITSLDLTPEGDRTAGTVSFKAAGCTGRVDFTAEHRDGAWVVTEFIFPTSKARLVLTDGRWRGRDLPR